MWNLQELRDNYEELKLVMYKQEKKVQFLETKALHLSMFYVASQLAIFLSTSKPSAHQCHNWWKPFFLSLSIAVLFGLNFTATIIKYVRTKYEQDRNFIYKEENFNQMVHLERHEATSMEMDVSKEYGEEVKPDQFGVYQRYVCVGLTVSALLGFTGVVLHTCRSAVCADHPFEYLHATIGDF